MDSFAELHTAGDPLLLPNAWDIASALLFADAGYPAVATTSMGVAATLGQPDGRRASRDLTVRIAEALRDVPVHVTVDLEDGHSDDPEEVAALVADLPIAGLNLEDSVDDHLVDPLLVVAKVEAIKRRRPDVFVNVRVDTYWLGEDDDEEATARRAATYAAAGADGIFVPGVSDLELIARLASAVVLPLNVLAVPGASLETLGRAGVRRVSTGSLPYRVALQAGLDAAAAVREGTEVGSSVTYPGLQAQLTAYVDSRP